MNLGENIYKFRTQKNMSQGDLADALDVSRQSVSKWENNAAVPELEKLVKMAQVFCITLDELVSGTTPDNASQQSPQESHVIYVDKPLRTGITPLQILGIILTVCSLLALTLSILLMSERAWEDSPFPLCIPIAVCGIICIVVKQYPGYFCALSLYFTFGLPAMILLTSDFDTINGIVYIAFLLYCLILLVYTIVRFRKIPIPTIFKTVILVLLTLTLIVRIVAMFPPRQQEAIPWEEFISTATTNVSPD